MFCLAITSEIFRHYYEDLCSCFWVVVVVVVFLSCNGISLIMEHCNVTAKSVLVSFKKKSQKTLFNYKLCQILAKIAYLLLSKEKKKLVESLPQIYTYCFFFFFKFET